MKKEIIIELFDLISGKKSKSEMLSLNNPSESEYYRFLENDNINELIGGNTILHLAIEKGYELFARKIIDQGYNLSAKNSEGKTPLHIAISNGC